MNRNGFLFFLFCIASATAVQPAWSATVAFTVDPTQSSLTLNSTTSVFGTPLGTTPQGTGSLVTSYSGTIYADVTGSTIQILAPTTIIAGISGDWLPGTDYSGYPGDLGDTDGYVSTPLPANYGLITDLTPLGAVLGVNGLSPSAIRDLEIALVDPAPKALTAGTFSEVGISTDFTSGTIFYSSGGSPPITDLATTVTPGPTVDALGTGTLTTAGVTQTLTIPVSFGVTYNVNFLTVTSEYTGTIVATAVVPEPSGFLLMATAVGCMAIFAPRTIRRKPNTHS